MLLCAYYYAWYVPPWLHKTVRGLDPPAIGEYENMCDVNVMRRHFRDMMEHGIDFAPVSVAQRQNIGHVIDAANAEGFKICAHYESLERSMDRKRILTDRDVPFIIEDLKCLKDDMNEECWMRIDGRPVVMLYVSRCYVDPADFDRVRDALGDVYLVGDEIFWGTPARMDRLSRLDAATTYNWFQPGRLSARGMTPGDAFLDNIRKFMKEQDFGDTPYWPVIMPGYDDRGVRPKAGHEPIPRDDGKFFAGTIRDALAASPLVIACTSYNEWFEDTQIESSYNDDKYMDMVGRIK